MATDFTPLHALAGGALIGLAAVLLLLLRGRIAGVSGIAARLLPPYRGAALLFDAAFVFGLVAAPVIYTRVAGFEIEQTIVANFPTLVIAGLLTGFGAYYGNGCTSGHGVCGLSRLSLRSLVATLVFMATAAVTVFAVRHGV